MSEAIAGPRVAPRHDERIFVDVAALLDDRTRRILERRRSGGVHDRGWLIRRALVVADITGIVGAFVASAVVAQPSEPASIAVRVQLSILLLTLPGWVVLAKLYGLYDRDGTTAYHSTIDDIGRLFHFLLLATWLWTLGLLASGLASFDVVRTTTFWLVAVALVTACRALSRAFARRRVEYLQNTVIVGGGDVGQLAAKKFLAHPECGLNLVGFVDAAPKARRDDLEHLTLLGPPEDLPELVELLDIERVVIAFSNESHEELLDTMRTLKDLNVQIDIVPRLFDLIGPGAHVYNVEGLPLIGLAQLSLARSSRFLKRTLDLVVSTLALLLLSPLFALIALLIKLDSRGPVVFRQARMGMRERPFDVLKFRTMVRDAEDQKGSVQHLNRHLEANGDPRMFKIINDPRVTPIGAFLRRYFIDELPQLVNVLRGEMSLIGPRPLILEEARHVDSWARRRLDLKPGMTGVWQVLGRSAISFEEMVKLDYLYVTTWSLGKDIRLLLETIPLVLHGEEAV